MKKTYVFFADGFEEIEALTAVDVMRRAGMPVVTVSIYEHGFATGAHGVIVSTDTVIEEVELDDAAWLVLPGGMPGATNLRNCEQLCDALKAQNERDGGVAAICASPAIVLAPLGILNGREATCYPGMQADGCGVTWVDRPAVTCGNVITGQGPALAPHFALAIVAAACGDDAAHQVAAGMLM